MARNQTTNDQMGTHFAPGASPAVVGDSATGCRLITTEVHIEGVGICTPTRDEYLRFLDGRAAQIRGEAS